jgi:Replicative DNA helicase
MNSNEQKLVIETLLSSTEVFSRCLNIIDGEYFDPEYQKVVNFIKEYSEKYSSSPAFDIINAKYDHGYKAKTITHNERDYYCDTIEAFCQQQAMINAVYAASEKLNNGDLGAIKAIIDHAYTIQLQRDMGIEMFDNPEQTLRDLLENDVAYSTLINSLDEYLDGGLFKKTLTLFSANSGGGKSVMLSNLGCNYSIGHGMNVLYISLELPEKMIFKRNAFIMTRTASKDWREQILPMAAKIDAIAREGAGSFRVKRLPTGCCANDIRSYLKQYEIEYGVKPDVLILDYLDLMSPNEGIKNLQVFDQDKLKSEQLVQILHDFDCIGITASQQNREALKSATKDQSVIAGGISKVNTVDNYISLFSDGPTRAAGEMIAVFLKTRSSSGVGSMVTLGFDTSFLLIGDKDAMSIQGLAKNIKARIANRSAAEEGFDNLPGLEGSTIPKKSKLSTFIETDDAAGTGDVVMTVTSNKRNVADLSGIDKRKKSRTKPAPEPTGESILAEEAKLDSYGTIDYSNTTESDVVLTEQQEEFIAKHNVPREFIERNLQFMEY